MTFSRGAILLLAASLAACQQAAAPSETAPMLVRTETVALVDWAPEFRLTGEIRARAEIPLAFRVTGEIVERLVDIGDTVEAGQLLARLDPQSQEADLQTAEAAVVAATADIDQARAAFERQQTLMNQGLITRTVFEQAETALQTAEGALDVAEAQRDTAREALGYTELRATVAGVITDRTLDTGEVAQAAQPVFTVAENGPLDAVFDVQEVLFLAQPDNATIRLASVADPARTTTGIVRTVSPALDPRSGTVEVKIDITEALPGMTLGSAVIGTVSGAPREAIVLPWSALWSDSNGPAVWIVDPAAHTVSLTPVTIGSHRTGSVVLSGGLSSGQIVVTEGGKLLRPGQVVEISAEPGA